VQSKPGLLFGKISSAEAHTPEVGEVLSLCIYNGNDPARRAAALAIYDDPNNWLLGVKLDGRLVALAGLRPMGSDIEIRHLAVLPGQRSLGIGRRLVEVLRAQSPGRKLRAETDKDAVGFYEKCGFTCRSLGEKYPGTERFECTG